MKTMSYCFWSRDNLHGKATGKGGAYRPLLSVKGGFLFFGRLKKNWQRFEWRITHIKSCAINKDLTFFVSSSSMRSLRGKNGFG